MAQSLGEVFAAISLRLDNFESGIKNVNKNLEEMKNKANQSTQSMTERMGKLGDTMTKKVTLPIGAATVASVKAAMDWQSAWTGVTKTVDGSIEQMEGLEKGIRDMSKVMPTSANEIAGVAEAAGQLGIQTDNVLDFTKTMVMLGDSTNLSADEAATTLARFANITQMSQKDFDKLGSTIVDLGNNFATTEAEISAMALRLAGAGKQIGMSESQILGFATALSSVGIEAEAGGSAFSKVFVDMQLAAETGGESLQQFANVAGMSAEEFKTAFQQDASGAMISFIKGLSTCEERGVSAIKVLDEMGITEVRMRDALLRAAGAGDLFGNAISTANKAWSENVALSNEAEKRYATDASKLAMLKNEIIDTGVSIGQQLMPTVLQLMKTVEGGINAFNKLDDGTKKFIINTALMTATIGPALKVISGMGKAVIGTANAFSKGVTFVKSFTGSLGSGLGVIESVTKASKKASGASGIGGFVSALKYIAPVAAPAAVAIGAVAGAVKLANTYHEVGKKTVLDTADSYTFLEKVMAKFRGTTVYTKKELEEMGLIHKEYGKNISKDFQKAIEDSSKKLAEMRMELGQINLDKVITQEENDSFVSGVNDMVEKTLETLNTKKERSTSLMKELFSYDGVIDEAEQHNLEIISKNVDSEIEEVGRLKEEVNTIMQRKVDEHRELNEQEVKDVNEKIARIKEIELLGQAQTKEEILLAKNEFNERVKSLDLKAASELLQEKRKGIEEELIETKSKYDTAIQMQEGYLENASEEEKQGITDRINQLKEEKEKVCKEKADMWKEYLRIAEEGNKNIKDNINKYNGEILDDDDKFCQRTLENQQQRFHALDEITETGWYHLYDNHDKTYKDIFVTVDEVTGEVIAAWDTETKKIGAYSEEIGQKNKELAKNYESTKQTISDHLQGWQSAHMNARGEIIDSNGQICGSLQQVTENTDGTMRALIDMAGRQYEITINKDGAITSCNEVTGAINNIPSQKTVDIVINKRQNFIDDVMNSTGANGKQLKNVFGYATGTNDFPGGFTYMHEQGYELYNLPSGSKIYNHDASEAAVKEMVSKVFEENMKKFDNGGSSLNLNIEKFYNNRKQDVKALAEELEFYRMQQAKARGHRT